MKYHVLSAILFITSTSTALAISYPIKNGPSSTNVSANIITSCAAASTADDFNSKTVSDQRIRNLSSIFGSQKANFFTSLSQSTDPTATTTRFSNVEFDFEGLNQIGLYYSDPSVPSDNGGIHFNWDVCLHVRVFDGGSNFKQITYYSDANTPTDSENYCYEGPAGDDQKYIALSEGLLNGRSVINREWGFPGAADQMISDDITLGWVATPIIPAPLPVSGNFYEPMAFSEQIYIEDAFNDLDGDGVASNDMGWLFGDLIAEGLAGDPATAVANYSIEILIPGYLESRCQSLAGETDPNLIWTDYSGSGEQGRVDYDTEGAYLNY